MRFMPIIAIFLLASVIKTVSSETLSTILGLSQGSPSTSTLTAEDCLSTINLQDIVFLSAVPIAAGFGLLLLLAFLQDLRQARKSNRSCLPSPCNIRGNRARKERIYVIDVDYAGHSRWFSFLRWFAMHKSPGANKNPRLVRLQGTFGFSNWLSFDLIPGKNSEQKTLTTPRSIGKLVAVETKYPSASDGFTSRLLPSSNIGACLRGIVNRACDIEIKKIHAMDTKTQDHYTSGCGSSSGGISSSDQGITTILPLLLSPAQPVSRVNYIAYYFKNGSLWTSAFTPWRQGNFTGCRRITCLFACISYTMVAVQVMSEPALDPSLGEFVVGSPMDFDITMGMVIKAAGVSAVLFPFLIMIEALCRKAPTILSSCGQPAMSTPERNGNLFLTTANSSRPMKVQSAAGDFYSDGDDESITDEFPRMSISAPDIQWQGTRPNDDQHHQHANNTSCCNNIGNQCTTSGNTSGIGIKPALNINSHVAITVSDDICVDHLSICADDQLECHHKLTCYKCPVCHRTTGSRYYNPGASCSGNNTLTGYDLYNLGGLLHPGYAYSSSSLNSVDSSSNSLSSNSTMANISKSSTSDSSSYINRSESSSISDSTSISGQPLDESASYNIIGAIKTKTPDDNHFDNVDRHQTAPSMSTSKEPSQLRPDSIVRASTSGLLDKKHKITCKWEAGDRSQPVKHLEDENKMKQKDNGAQEKFIKYYDALLEPDIKIAKVLRTKNYITRFSDMGKGRWVSLPELDVHPSEEKFNTSEMTDKSNLSVPGTKSELKITQTPNRHIPGTTVSDYIVNLPVEFEMPSVTIQRSRSNKPFFFSFRKWLPGFRSKPKVGDDYKLELKEYDAAMKTSDENICVPCSHDVAMETSTIENEGEAKCDTISRGSSQSPGIANKTLPNIPNKDNINAKMIDDNLKRSIFKSSSLLIEYQPDAISVVSSGSWSSIVSSQDGDKKQLTRLKYTNENNNNQVTIIKIQPCDEPSVNVSVSNNSDTVVDMDTSQSSSSSVTVPTGSTENNNIATTDSALASINQNESQVNQGQSEAISTTNKKHGVRCRMSVLAGFSQVLLIASCVLAVLWSVSSFHGLCWQAFWEWVATSIIAILIHAVILDTIKAIVVTVKKRRGDKIATTTVPHTLIY